MKVAQNSTGPGRSWRTPLGQAAAGSSGWRGTPVATAPISDTDTLGHLPEWTKPDTSPVSQSMKVAPSRTTMSISRAWSSGPSRRTAGRRLMTPSRRPRRPQG